MTSTPTTGTTTRRPLTSRPLDLLYFVFFLIHIPASLLMDTQTQPFLRTPLLAPLSEWYLNLSSDPFLLGVYGSNGPTASWTWFQSFLILELVFQVPVFFLGAHALYTDNKTIYPLLLIYGASTATTLIPCLATVLITPVAPVPPLTAALLEQTGMISITSAQRNLLLQSYIPFLIIPMLMAVDMAGRIGELMIKGLEVEEREKAK